MKLDCVRCNKCGKVHSVEKGCDLPEAEASAERISSVICNYERIPKGDFMEFKKGDRVVDDDGRYGIVVDAKNIHNIIVEYDGKNIGSGMYCVDKTCIEYDRLKKVRS